MRLFFTVVLICQLLHGQSASQQVLVSEKIIAGIVATGKGCANQSFSGNPITCTWSSAPVAGETIYCFISNSSGGSTYTITDNAGTPNTYTANGAVFNSPSTFADYQMFRSFNIANSPTTSSITASGSTFFLTILCMSVTGATNVVDGAIGTGNQASGASLSATINPTGTKDIAFCGTVGAGGSTVTPGSGYTAAPSVIGTNIKGVYKILTASGSQSASVNNSPGTGSTDLICATYK